jgi:serine/threonine protein kinase
MEFFEIDDKVDTFHMKSGTYQKVQTLGEGAFGKVLLVVKVSEKNQKGTKKDSYKFALKISKRFQKKSKAKKNEKEESKNSKEIPREINFVELRELTILKKLSRSHHLNIVNLLDYQLGDTETLILMDYVQTDLMKFFALNKNNPKIMNEKFFKNIAHQIISGVNHLHSQQIIHRDIKLENILYDEKNNTAKIGDFGLSRVFDYSLESQYTDVGTYPYKPPEILLGLKKYTPAFDIWSIGCLLVQICTMNLLFGANDSLGVLKLMYEIFGSFNDGVLPGFKHFPNSNLIENLPEKKGFGLIEYIKLNKKFDFEDENFYDLISKMLCIDPTKRISAKKCLEHPWFKTLDLF